MSESDSKAIKSAVLGVLVTASVGGVYWFIADHFALATLVEGQSQYVKRDVLDPQMKVIEVKIDGIDQRFSNYEKNQLLMMRKLNIEPVGQNDL